MARNWRERSLSLDLTDPHASHKTTAADVDYVTINALMDNFTSSSLSLCRQTIIKPFDKLLKFIGWKAFQISSNKEWKKCSMKSCFDKFYLILILLSIIYSYTYEIGICNGELTTQDVIPPIIHPSNLTPHHQPHSKNTIMSLLTSTETNFNISDKKLKNVFEFRQCDHFISTYILPDLLQLIAFFLGLYYYRYRDSESLYTLMENVFLQAIPLKNKNVVHGSHISQQKLIRRIKNFIIVGVIWFIVGVLLHVFSTFLFSKMIVFQKDSVEISTITRLEWFVFFLSIFGTIINFSIPMVIIINFIIHCELLVFYMKCIRVRIECKLKTLSTIMRDIQNVQYNLNKMNRLISKMVSLVFLAAAQRFIIGCCILMANKNDYTIVWIYRGIYPLFWLFLLFATLAASCRLNMKSEKFRSLSQHIFIYGYPQQTRNDVETFYKYTINLQLKSKLFELTIHPGYIFMAITTFYLTVILLIQTNMLHQYNKIF
ncbi:hypothetical protein SNEBB_010503 [Seison nebaliae]|nr:hypothetical protein SNEBB_010503 [Seison nebaliae]